jgi:hypothetical protein
MAIKKMSNAWGMVAKFDFRNMAATTVPKKITIGTATTSSAGNASVSFTLSDTPVYFYRATSYPEGISGSSTTSPIPIQGLSTTATTKYTFTVVAVNLYGYSEPSNQSNILSVAYNPSGGYLQ